MISLLVFLSFYLNNLEHEKISTKKEMISYLALGDSYTIGESVPEKLRWPNLLSKKIGKAYNLKVETTIIAKTGWTSDELITAIKSSDVHPRYDLVSLLIGVNNQYRGYEIRQYEAEFEELLKLSIDFASGRKERVFAVSIPDYGITPFAKEKNPEKIQLEIDNYNRIAEEICMAHGISFIEITEISRMAVHDTSLIADDRLHPSGKMYQEWVEKVFPVVRKVLNPSYN